METSNIKFAGEATKDSFSLKQSIILSREFLHTRRCQNASCSEEHCSTTREILRHAFECKTSKKCTQHCQRVKDLLEHLEKCTNVRCQLCRHVRPAYPNMHKPDTDKFEFLGRRHRIEQLGLLYLHAITCIMVPEKCTTNRCAIAKRRLEHMHSCDLGLKCPHDWCITGAFVLGHMRNCTSSECLLCSKRIQHAKGTIPYNKGLTVAQIRNDVRELIGRYFTARKIKLSDLVDYGFAFDESIETQLPSEKASICVEKSLFDLTPTFEWYMRTFALMWLGGYTGYFHLENVDDVSLKNAVWLFNDLEQTLTETAHSPIELVAQTFWSVHRRSMKAPQTPFSDSASSIHVRLWRRLGELDRHMDALHLVANK